MWKDQYTANASEGLTQPRLDASDDDIVLALLGFRKKPKGGELREFVSSPTVMEARETLLAYWKKKTAELTHSWSCQTGQLLQPPPLVSLSIQEEQALCRRHWHPDVVG